MKIGLNLQRKFTSNMRNGSKWAKVMTGRTQYFIQIGIESKFILTTYKNKLCLKQSFSDAKYKYYYYVETLQEII